MFYKIARTALSRHPNAIVLASCLFVLVALLLFSVVLYGERQDAYARAVDTARNLSMVVDREVTRNLEVYDLSLKSIAESIDGDDGMTLVPELRRLWAFDHASKARYVQGIFFLDANGDIAAEGDTSIKARGNFSDRDYFKVQRDRPDTGFYISHPYYSRLRHGVRSIAFSRRVSRRDGSFAGVVAISVHLNYFSDLLAGLQLGSHGTVTLLCTDGTVIMRYPNTPGAIGRNYKGRPNFARVSADAQGVFFGRASVEGTRKLYIYRRLGDLPLILTVAPAEEDIYADWRQRAILSGLLAGLLSAGFVALSVFLSREFRYRLDIEAKLLHASRTDSVTGLVNRRTLDDSLLQEWRRACRSHEPLAILFIDIDRFKSYNDTYGHQRGDETLTYVANAIQASLRRATDIAARYGGEEFMVVLPDTAKEGAHAVAAAIHDKLRALRVEHAGSKDGMVTVSIGLATWQGEPIDGVTALIDAADDALYQAKSQGRNRTVERAGFGQPSTQRPARGDAAQ